MSVKLWIRRITPRFLINFYHGGEALFANLVFGFPARRLTVVGVTGTKGKTTTVHLIAAILRAQGIPTGFISTVAFDVGEGEKPNHLKMTSPPAWVIQQWLWGMIKNGVRLAVLEVSSHALTQQRFWGIPFATAVFTNLAPEHIEYHGGFRKYREAKAKLFKKLRGSESRARSSEKTTPTPEPRPPSTIIVNLDDPAFDYFAKFSADRYIGYSLTGKHWSRGDTVSADTTELTNQGSSFTLSTDSQSARVSLKLLGRFNIANALAAASIGVAHDVSLTTIVSALEAFSGVPGRMEMVQVREDQPITVIVDYAHTPESLTAVYETVKLLEPRRIIGVLGGTGDRDRAKRPVMGEIAGRMADIVVVTNEDPYSEDPEKIIDEVLAGVLKGGKRLNEDLLRVSDRGDAIRLAIKQAEAGDVVFITGKGAENVIVEGNRRIPFDDREVAREALKRRFDG